ncbi:MAG TPA: lipopolysaccharide transport periplasmic protein LptA [Burkholderiales bacterium]
MSPTESKSPLVAAALALALAGPAAADRADRDKPINLEADRVTVDDAKQVAVFEGNVRLSQGTLTIRADKVVVREDKDGYQHATAYGQPANLRQKREGAEEWIEGWGERMEYDGRSEQIELHNQARIVRGKDEVRGNYISYNSVTEFFQAEGAKGGGPAARVKAVIQPKPRGQPPASPPVSIKPADSLGQ